MNKLTQLKPKQKKFLRSRAHDLAPVIRTGNAGLSHSVLKELELALEHHELIKIKLGGADKSLRQQLSDEICTKTNAVMIQMIGHILIVYRPAKEARIKLP